MSLQISTYAAPKRKKERATTKTPPKDNNEDIPEYLRNDNPFIVSGFRGEINTWQNAIKSMILYHNETFNIWSHLIASLGFLASGIYFLVAHKHPSTWAIVMNQFAFASVLFISSMCHTFCAINQTVFTLVWKIDHAAISVAITSTFFPFVWYIFRNTDDDAMLWRILYLSVACVLGLAGVYINLVKHGLTRVRLTIYGVQGA
jgi:adiponectin receptor